MSEELKVWDITNLCTGEKKFTADYNPKDACQQVGWIIGDCFITEQKPRHKYIPGQETRLLIKVYCKVCPYQYAECKKPGVEECPARPSAPELQEWLKQAAEAHLCPHVGVTLAKTDYGLGQKWVPMEEAIKELTTKP